MIRLLLATLVVSFTASQAYAEAASVAEKTKYIKDTIEKQLQTKVENFEANITYSNLAQEYAGKAASFVTGGEVDFNTVEFKFTLGSGAKFKGWIYLDSVDSEACRFQNNCASLISAPAAAATVSEKSEKTVYFQAWPFKDYNAGVLDLHITQE